MRRSETITPDWRWGTAEGSRDLDRILDRRLSFREKLEWLEEAETLSLLLSTPAVWPQKRAGRISGRRFRSLQSKARARIRCLAIDIETVTIFITGVHNEIPTGALFLVSDQPMVPEGVNTAASNEVVTSKFMELHLRIGIDSLSELINHGLTVKHLRSTQWQSLICRGSSCSR